MGVTESGFSKNHVPHLLLQKDLLQKRKGKNNLPLAALISVQKFTSMNQIVNHHTKSHNLGPIQKTSSSSLNLPRNHSVTTADEPFALISVMTTDIETLLSVHTTNHRRSNLHNSLPPPSPSASTNLRRESNATIVTPPLEPPQQPSAFVSVGIHQPPSRD